MSWQLYPLRFRVLSPLHVGRQKIGNIQLARPYVMARHLWAAVTARLTRQKQYAGADGNAEAYKRMGDQVKEELAFTYLYPEDHAKRPLFSRFTEQGLKYGKEDKEIGADVFAWRYLNSYASTALNYSINAAEEGALHEAEYLAPHTRKDGDCPSHPVFLTGYLFERKGCKLDWQQALTEIQIGGERKSGWGRLQLCSDLIEPLLNQKKLFDVVEWQEDQDRPQVKITAGQPLLAHAIVQTQGEKIIGEIEPLVGRIWDGAKGAGQRHECPGVCYAPGSDLRSGVETLFEFSQDHIWKPVNGVTL